ncbi:MAG: hypothetical protein L0Y54_00760 [Sporichthyaceae bacterium]|nr:hypothetical protein [Sporichthyaceae bacterium]
MPDAAGVPDPLPRDPFTTADARTAGYRPHRIRDQLDAGAWIALRRGVYCTAGRQAHACTALHLAHELDVLAAQLAVVRPTVASGWSAALLHGLPMPITWSGQPPPFVTLTTRSGWNKVIPGVRLHLGPLDDDQVDLMSSVLVTSPLRTAVDLARWADQSADALAVADAVLHRADATTEQLAALLARFRSRSGMEQARWIVGAVDPRAESPLESHSRIMFARQGLPTPETQVEIRDGRDRLVARVDFLWREMSTIGEADGRLKYAIGDAVYREKQREDRLRELGFEVVRWDFSDLRFSPRATANRIRTAFDRGHDRPRDR